MRYPIKSKHERVCDTIVASIARYEEYRCWASKCKKTLLQERNSLLRSCRSTVGDPNRPNWISSAQRSILVHSFANAESRFAIGSFNQNGRHSQFWTILPSGSSTPESVQRKAKKRHPEGAEKHENCNRIRARKRQ